jgi:hypothetical protein
VRSALYVTMLAGAAMTVSTATAETAVLSAAKDNTLYGSDD